MERERTDSVLQIFLGSYSSFLNFW